MSYRQSDKKDTPHADLPAEGREAAQRAVALLARVLDDPEAARESLDEFQHSVWLDPDQFESDIVGAVLGELAFDLDGYEPDPKRRREDSDLFGEDRVRELIRNAFNALNEHGIAVPHQAK